MKRVLLTGASGFVGANLARRLLLQGHEVHALLRPNHQAGRLNEIQQDLHLHVGSLSDAAFLESTLAEAQPDWIFHLAAHGAYSWQTDLGQILATNVSALGTLLSCAAARGFECFVNTGSSSEYGWSSQAPTEETRLEPNSYYAISKAAATHLCRLTASRTGTYIPTLRLYSVYGPWEEPKRFIPTLIREGLRGKYPPLVSPDTVRDFVHVDDVCDAYLAVAAAKSADGAPVYNIGSGVETTIREVVQCIGELLPIEGSPSWGTMPNRSWDTATWVANPAKAKQALGWSAQIPLKSGLASTIEWMRSAEFSL